jgi:hypothetical protein
MERTRLKINRCAGKAAAAYPIKVKKRRFAVWKKIREAYECW